MMLGVLAKEIIVRGGGARWLRADEMAMREWLPRKVSVDCLKS